MNIRLRQDLLSHLDIAIDGCFLILNFNLAVLLGCSLLSHAPPFHLTPTRHRVCGLCVDLINRPRRPYCESGIIVVVIISIGAIVLVLF
jgi:hypothetical protein